MLPIIVNEPAAEPVQKAAPKPAPAKEKEFSKPISRRPDTLKTPSIKDALAGKLGEDKLTAKQQHEVFHGVTEVNEFSAEALELKWKEFVAKLNDRPNLQSTLSRIPVIEEDYRLVLYIDNTVQEDLISTIKPELISWLRTGLKNSKIEMVTVINEQVKERLIYTDSEKYLEMLKKNPQLDILKQRFKLDFE